MYFDYRIVPEDHYIAEQQLIDELLNNADRGYFETKQFFQEMDSELITLSQKLALSDPYMAHYLNLINAKIECLAQHLLLGKKFHLRKVDLSLNGFSFRSNTPLEINTRLKIALYTKPKFIPLILDATVARIEDLTKQTHLIVVVFASLSAEQEQLLNEHILFV